MNMQIVADVATLFEAIAVIVSLIFIAIQIRQSTRLAKIANAQSVVEHSKALATTLAQDRQLTELWIAGIENYDSLDGVDQYRFLGFLTYLLNVHEHAYYQLKEGLLDKNVYSPNESELKALIKVGVLQRHWKALRSQFQPVFVAYVEQMLESAKTPGA